MLKINLLNTQETIKYLTSNNTKIPPFEYLLTVTKFGDILVINTKSHILSVRFKEMFTNRQIIEIKDFIDEIGFEGNLYFDKDFIFNIHYTDNTYDESIAVADAAYLLLEKIDPDKNSYIIDNLFNTSDLYNKIVGLLLQEEANEIKL